MAFIIKNLSRTAPRPYRMRIKARVISRKFNPVFAAITGWVLLSLPDTVKQKQIYQKGLIFYGMDSIFQFISGRRPLLYPM